MIECQRQPLLRSREIESDCPTVVPAVLDTGGVPNYVLLSEASSEGTDNRRHPSDNLQPTSTVKE